MSTTRLRPAVVTVDAGTTSLRAVLFDASGRVLHVEAHPDAPRYSPDGRVVQDAAVWRRALVLTLSGAAAAAARIGVKVECIAVTAQRSSVLAVDAEGAPLAPAIMWQDKRAAGLAHALAPHTEAVYRATGMRISPVFSAAKMLWLRRERPEIWAKATRLIGVQEWILWLLTGRHVTDHSLASRTNLFDLARLDWSEEMLGLFEVPRERLCDLVPPGARVGVLDVPCAVATGLVPGIPVVSAGGDQQCAALGLGLVGPGLAVTNAGTGGYVLGHAPRPTLDPEMRVSCNVAAIAGAYIVEAAILTAGAAHRWFASVAGAGGALADRVEPALLDRLEREASAEPPGAGGVVALPHFEGAGTPSWDAGARGAFVNLGLATTRGAMARAILEGVAVELKGGLDVIESLCGRAGAIHAAGGLARSDLFARIQCDALERPLRLHRDEATARGAWIAGAVATGLSPSHAAAYASSAAAVDALEPDPRAQEAYRALVRRSRIIYAALAAPEVRAALAPSPQPSGS